MQIDDQIAFTSPETRRANSNYIPDGTPPFTQYASHLSDPDIRAPALPGVVGGS